MREWIIAVLAPYQPYLLPLAVFLVLCAISFEVNDWQTQWYWNHNPLIPMLMIAITLVLVWVWIKVEQTKSKTAYQNLQAKYEGKADAFSQKWETLSIREQAVLTLIGQGKSNKEICVELFIEMSTLKSHINRLYRKLGITHRKEARLLAKLISPEA